METLAALGGYIGGAWASGINLYLTAAALGVAGRMGLIELPGTLDILSHPLVIIVVSLLFIVEFLADKIPYVDSLWDSAHTFIRPAAAAFLAFKGASGLSPHIQLSLSLICGTVALDSHLTKATARAAINTSPEPFTNIIASVSEDVLVVAMLYAIVRHPVIAGVIVMLFILFSVWFLRTMFRFVRRIFRRAPAVIAVILLPALTAGSFDAHAGDANVILISVDALRADHLGCYGYERDTSPHIDKLAAHSVVFDRAYTQSTFTPPSHASLFTSLYVKTHGVNDWIPMRPEVTTIAEILSGTGYMTGCVAAKRMFTRLNMDQGFSMTRCPTRPARKINEHSSAWLDTVPPDKNFFLFLHYYDVHRPYNPGKPYKTMFTGNSRKTYNASTDMLMDIWKKKIRLDREDIDYIDALYDGQIRQFDAEIGRFFSVLKEKGLYDKTLIILTADHGEMMGYHYNPRFRYTHDPVLYDGVIRVPLIMKFPDNSHEGTRLECPVESIDIVPTILAFLDPDRKYDVAFQGKDLNGVIAAEGAGKAPRGFVFSETTGPYQKKCIVKDGYKYIIDIQTGRQEVYDLKEDPLELKNIISTHPRLAKKLDALLWYFYDGLPAAPESGEDPAPSESDLAMLKSLGYVR